MAVTGLSCSAFVLQMTLALDIESLASGMTGLSCCISQGMTGLSCLFGRDWLIVSHLRVADDAGARHRDAARGQRRPRHLPRRCLTPLPPTERNTSRTRRHGFMV